MWHRQLKPDGLITQRKAQVNEGDSRKLGMLRRDYASVSGLTFHTFYCPFLFRDEPAELYRALGQSSIQRCVNPRLQLPQVTPVWRGSDQPDQ